MQHTITQIISARSMSINGSDVQGRTVKGGKTIKTGAVVEGEREEEEQRSSERLAPH